MSRKRPEVDPELRRQLGAGARAGQSSGRPVEAVVRLRPRRRSDIVPSPEQTRRIAEQLMVRVATELAPDAATYDLNVFANLGYFVVSAPSAFVARLIEQPEVAAATANRSA
ncbi:MAG: hypothetical protein IT373_13135 [Polyangiaceae bacterium]|nr:hypothetical protein [Polyangiaceae bacterium]